LPPPDIFFKGLRMKRISSGPAEGLDTLTFRVRCSTVRPYEVTVTEGALDPGNPLLARALGDRRALVVTTPTLEALWGRKLRRYLEAFAIDAAIAPIPLGEGRKTMATVLDVCRRAEELRLRRQDVLVSFGGGICTDVVSLAASLVRRGLPHISLPTTLVAQVDASVGLKGGVNFGGHKNRLGCYWPPQLALLDLSWLSTLPPEEFLCGMAEILKMGLVRDEGLFSVLERMGSALIASRFQDPPMVARRVVERSVQLILEELEPNGFEDRTLERVVDFGHTFSGVLEEHSGFLLRHGDAVAIDMALTCLIAVELGILSKDVWEGVYGIYETLGLPLYSPLCTAESMQAAIQSTLDHRAGKLNLVVPTEIGRAIFLREADSLPVDSLNAAIAALRRLGSASPRSVRVGTDDRTTGTVSAATTPD
jgi:3-dehydroquinate synthetase